MATRVAGKTPHGARPNRGARRRFGPQWTARPQLPGRLLDPASNGGARGMIVTPKSRRAPQGARRAKADRIRLTAGCGGLLSLADHRPVSAVELCTLIAYGSISHGSLPRHRRRGLHRVAPVNRTAFAAAIGSASPIRSSPASAAISITSASVEFLEGDLADADFARQAAEGCDYVLHQAAIPSVPRSVKDPITSNRANVDATLNMLVAARDAGVKRLVFAASSSAYGDTPTLPKHEAHADRAALAVRAAEGGRASSTCRCSRGSTASRP